MIAQAVSWAPAALACTCIVMSIGILYHVLMSGIRFWGWGRGLGFFILATVPVVGILIFPRILFNEIDKALAPQRLERLKAELAEMETAAADMAAMAATK